ncbi:hypothetical protein ACH4MJ_31115 [Streptomyces anulatus]
MPRGDVGDEVDEPEPEPEDGDGDGDASRGSNRGDADDEWDD